MADPPDDELLLQVVLADRALFDAGVEINQRSIEVPRAVMSRLGYVSYVLAGAHTPPVLERIRAQFGRLYSKQDVAIGGHIGVFMFRDVFARVAVPHAYGTVRINPLEFVELTDVQKRVLSCEPSSLAWYHDQFADLFDLQYGIGELKNLYAKNELVDRLLNLCRLHLHAAAAIVTGGYDHRGAVQSALLASELALKSLAAAKGLRESEIKDSFGHNAGKLLNFLEPQWPTLDAARVRRVVDAQPAYVPNRYSKEQPKRATVGHIIMGVQFLAAEVTRQISGRDFRRDGGNAWQRQYPA